MRTNIHVLKIISTAATIAAITTTSAMATQGCKSQTIDGGTHTETYISGMSGGGDGWDGQIERCEINGHVFLLPVGCGAPSSLSGPVAGPVYATKLVDNPDIDQFAKLDKKATAWAILVELHNAIKNHKRPSPVAPVYGPWQNGTCN